MAALVVTYNFTNGNERIVKCFVIWHKTPTVCDPGKGLFQHSLAREFRMSKPPLVTFMATSVRFLESWLPFRDLQISEMIKNMAREGHGNSSAGWRFLCCILLCQEACIIGCSQIENILVVDSLHNLWFLGACTEQ